MRPFALSNAARRRAFSVGAAALLVAAASPAVIPQIAPSAAAQDVPTGPYISEYIEGTSQNKAVEVFNPGTEPLDLAGYSLAVYSNSSVEGTEIPLTGTIAPGDVFTVGNSQASFADQLDLKTGKASWNGDDAIVLFSGDTVVDSFGQVGTDPGTAWGSGSSSTVDNTLRRTGGFPDTVIDDAFDPANGWEGAGRDAFDDLGVAPGGNTGPTDPTNPTDPTDPTDPAACEDPAATIGSVQGSTDDSPE
ncbi:lamin tail domain-containing protein, partial [Dietzia sp.]|uniref:lamin tail domain-containing protein n=1 Tax=Dietzia sp. TaxID=1871616 RepID=UPI002FD9EDEA